MNREQALDIVRKNWPDGRHQLSEALRILIPELKESEDEKIRKFLVDYFGIIKSTLTDGLWKGFQIEKILAWLEKLDKKEYALKSSKDEDVHKFVQYIERQAKAYELNLPNRSYDIYGFAKDILSWLEKQGEQNLANSEKTCKDEQKPTDNIESSAFKDKLLELFQKFRWIKKGVPTNGDIIEYVDAHIQELINTIQNPAWSEEDEIGFRDAMWAIEQARTIAKDENDMGNLWYAERWLKSLKSRVQPYPKSEWSEEDVRMINSIIENLDGGEWFDIYQAEWLKSLKDRYTWKPSEEQMQALELVVQYHAFANTGNREKIVSLFDDLKKLK